MPLLEKADGAVLREIARFRQHIVIRKRVIAGARPLSSCSGDGWVWGGVKRGGTAFLG